MPSWFLLPLRKLVLDLSSRRIDETTRVGGGGCDRMGAAVSVGIRAHLADADPLLGMQLPAEDEVPPRAPWGRGMGRRPGPFLTGPLPSNGSQKRCQTNRHVSKIKLTSTKKTFSATLFSEGPWFRIMGLPRGRSCGPNRRPPGHLAGMGGGLRFIKIVGCKNCKGVT